MNKLVYVSLAALFVFVALLFSRQEISTGNNAQLNNQPLLESLEKINYNLSKLSSRIDQININNQQQWLSRNSINHSAEQSNAEAAIVIPNSEIEPESITQVMDAQSSRSVKSLQERPPMVVVNPTPQQNETYQQIKLQLDDLDYLSTLNLQEFSQSPEIADLPETLQLVLISKAIKHYNNGDISKDVFLNNQ